MTRNTREILEVLVNNIEKKIDINIKKREKIRTNNMFFFTVEKIEIH